MLLYRSSSSSADYALLKDGINRISMWVDANYQKQKCKVMKVTRKRTGISPPTLHLCDQPLEEVDSYSYKYLGILLSSDLSWTRHIESLCSIRKARKLTGLIYCYFYQHLSLRTYFICMFRLFVFTSSMRTESGTLTKPMK